MPSAKTKRHERDAIAADAERRLLQEAGMPVHILAGGWTLCGRDWMDMPRPAVWISYGVEFVAAYDAGNESGANCPTCISHACERRRYELTLAKRMTRAKRRLEGDGKDGSGQG
jgi:hypothetical protein